MEFENYNFPRSYVSWGDVFVVQTEHEEDSLLRHWVRAVFENGSRTVYFAKDFDDFSDIISPEDIVLAINASYPKVSDNITIGILLKDAPYYSKRPRLIRNLLTYDASYAATSNTARFVNNLYFSARKYSPIYNQLPILADPKGTNIKCEGAIRNVKLVCATGERTRYKKLCEELKARIHPVGVTIFTNDDSTVNWGGDSLNVPSLLGSSRDGIAIIFLSKTGPRGIEPTLSGLAASIAPLVIARTDDEFFDPYGDTVSRYVASDDVWLEVSRIISSLKSALAVPIDPSLGFHYRYSEQFWCRQQLGREIDFKKNFYWQFREVIKKGLYIDLPDFLKEQENAVTYIIRTGKAAPHLERALISLVNQSYKNIKILLVLYAELSDSSLISDSRWSEKITIVEDFGGLRSTGIIAGLRSIRTEYFAMLDDDDYLNKNHVATLMRVLTNASNQTIFGRSRLAYSGSYYHSTSIAFPESTEYWDELLTSGPKRRQVEHFHFYDPHLMSRGLWNMMSNSWIGHRSLLHERVLLDPLIHTHEDIYFELLFAEQTLFEFSCEMTAAHYIHGNNSTFVDVARNDQDIACHAQRHTYLRLPLSNFYRMFHHSSMVGISSVYAVQTVSNPVSEDQSVSSRDNNVHTVRKKSLLGLLLRFHVLLHEHGVVAAIRHTSYYLKARFFR
jgi:hypothetical protein